LPTWQSIARTLSPAGHDRARRHTVIDDRRIAIDRKKTMDRGQFFTPVRISRGQETIGEPSKINDSIKACC
jgi:hypothetical protein